MNADDPIAAMLANLNGESELAPEHVARWRNALRALQVRGPARARFKAFETALAMKPGKAGRRRKIVPLSVLALRADAVAAFRFREKKTGNTHASLQEVAREYGCTETDLDGWCENKLLVHLSRAAQHDGITLMALLDAEADQYFATQKSR
jgi:hypothetical protein